MSVLGAPVRDYRTGQWLEQAGFGVYVHIPFCKHRCHYCDFNTYEGRDDLHDAYVDALIDDVRGWAGESRPATSVFFPSSLTPWWRPGCVVRATS